MPKTYTAADMIVVGVICLAVGILGTTGFLWRDLNTSDYDLGHQMGYQSGRQDAMDTNGATFREGFRQGAESVKSK